MVEVKNAGYDEMANIYTIEKDVIIDKSKDVKSPIDHKLGSAYIHCLKNLEDVGNATFMLSYVWGYKIGDIVNSLVGYCTRENLDKKKTYVWICCLCLNQHRIREKRSRKECVPFEELQTVLSERITKINHVLAMTSPWDAPLYLTRVWCIFELYTAIENNCNMAVIAPTRERKDFIDGLRSSIKGADQMKKLITTLGTTDVRHAMASVKSDLTSILRLIESGPGYDCFNAMVTAELKKWAFNGMLSAVEVGTYGVKDKVSQADQGTLLMNVGYLFHDMGECGQALTMFKDALQIFDLLYGRDNQTTATSISMISIALLKKGEIDVAMEIQEQALAIREKVLGRDHEDTSDSLYWIACMLNDIGEKDRALKMHMEVLVIRQKVLGKEHKNTAKSLNNVGTMLFDKGMYDKALGLFEKVLGIRESLFGRQYIRTAYTICSIANVLNAKGMLYEALSMFKEALPILEKVRGRDDPRTVDVLQKIVNLSI